MKRILSLTLVAVMLLSSVAVLSSCDWFNPIDESLKGQYTYNTYMSSLPSSWNAHTYQTSTQSEIISYTEPGFYTFDYNETRDGFVVVPDMAAMLPTDVSELYVGEEWGIEEGDTARAWRITIRDDIRWDDGVLITATDFVESAKRLLNPVAVNYRADSLYSGDMAIVGAKAYFYGGRDGYEAAHSAYKHYSEDLDSKLVFTLGAPSDATNNAECYIRTYFGFPASYDAVACAAWLIEKYGSYMPDFTAKAAAAMEGKTLAEIKADSDLAKAWTSLLGFWQTEPDEELHFFITMSVNPVKDWSTVGIKAVSDTEIDIILEDSLEGFYLLYNLTGNLGLVRTDLYDSCITIDPETGAYSTTYATSVETYMGYGPYKLTSFQTDRQFVLERNDYWYGYNDEENANYYQTTKIVYDCIDDPNTAFNAFLKGELDGKSLDSDNVNEYANSDRIYYTDGSSTWYIALNPDLAAYRAWGEKAENAGKNKAVLTVKEFRQALSFSLDRRSFCLACDPTASSAFGVFNSMICSDPENGVMYRTTEEAKDALLSFWGISQDDIGAGKLYADKDEAIDSITGYNLAGAKELFNQAYDNAVAAGIYNGTDTIEICVGIPGTATFYSKGYEFLKNNWTEAVKGTKFEGKLSFTKDETLDSNTFADALRNNKVDLLFGVGWNGSALNPYGLIFAYTDPSYQYDPSWDTSAQTLDITINGKTWRASVADWANALSNDVIEIAEVDAEGNLTGEVNDRYSCGTATPVAERLTVLAAVETVVLGQYDMIPVQNQSSASLLGMQVEYGQKEYVYGVGRGGIKYMTYNFDDYDWVKFVRSEGGTLNYK